MTQSTKYSASLLSSRLRAVANLVPVCSRLLDIGTDHAWLPIELVRLDRCQTAIAIDIRSGPLSIADRHIKNAGLADRIKTIQTNGLQNIELGREDVVVLAGMGGYEMMEILGPEPRHCKALILQPMKSLPELRLWLYRNGYALADEKLVIEKNHAYVILSCQHTGHVYELNDLQALVGPCLLADPKIPGLLIYLEKLQRRLHKQSRGEPSLLPVIDQIQKLTALIEGGTISHGTE